MSTRVGDRLAGAARARAVAASIFDAPRVPRRFAIPDRADLRASGRRRRSAPRVRPLIAVPPRRSRGRVIAALLAAQLALLAALFILPVFRASTIDVRGARMLSRDALLANAGVSPSQSIFTIDGDAVRARLERLPWVRSATVETELPGTVRISVTEWSPILRIRDLRGERLVAPGGATLDVAMAKTTLPPLPLLVDERSSPPPLDPTLGRTLAAVAEVFPAAVGSPVSSFDWQTDGRLAIVAAPGWRAILGGVADDAHVAAIPEQIAALVALRQRLDLLKPTFGYIDLIDPRAPAVGGARGSAPAPGPAQLQAGGGGRQDSGARASASPSPPPATPQPTPFQFQLSTPPPRH